MTRRGLFKAALRSSIGLAGFSAASIFWADSIEPELFEVNPVDLTLPRLSPAFEGFRIAHISDIHMDTWMTRTRLDRIVDLINEQQPDVVAITGDFITFGPERLTNEMRSGLSALQPREALIGVLGNHDHWGSAHRVRAMMQKAGIADVGNTVHTLRRGGEMLHLAGVDDPWAGEARLDDVLKQLPSRGAAVLLAHEPDFADEYAPSGRFDLQLSGHTHGGQIRLPIVGPLVLPTYGVKYHTGLYHVGNMMVYTTRGVGMVQPCLRYNCRPEITLLTLHAPDS